MSRRFSPEGRPSIGARGLHGLLVGSAQRSDLDPAASGGGLVDLRAAAQQELLPDPAVLSFGTAGASNEIERVVSITNVSSRRLVVSIGNAAIAPKGVEITVDPRASGSGRVGPPRSSARCDGRRLDEAGAATGDLVLRVADSPEVHVPWAVAVPLPADLLTRVSLEATEARVSDTTPAVLSLVAGAVTATPDPQVRAVELLEVELWRGGTNLGVIARRRELLPGRYTFGLTGRGPDGDRLGRGRYVVRVVAYPGDGTRRAAQTVEYRVR